MQSESIDNQSLASGCLGGIVGEMAAWQGALNESQFTGGLGQIMSDSKDFSNMLLTMKVPPL